MGESAKDGDRVRVFDAVYVPRDRVRLWREGNGEQRASGRQKISNSWMCELIQKNTANFFQIDILNRQWDVCRS